MIRIRFGTYTFDRVTRLLKANFVDKLSHFGGTAGLFTGGSFISVFELILFVVTLLIMLGQFLTNKIKKLKTVQAQESKANETEKTNEDIDKKFNNITQKIVSMERDFNKTLMALESLEKEVKEKVDVRAVEKVIEKKIDQEIIGNFLDKYGPNQ